LVCEATQPFDESGMEELLKAIFPRRQTLHSGFFLFCFRENLPFSLSFFKSKTQSKHFFK